MENSIDACIICSTINLIAYALLGITCLIILIHIISTVYLKLQPHLKLTSQSFVVITGGCQGIGREMAIQIAKLYHSKILILDYRQDLFPEIQAALDQFGSKCECYQCDLADDSAVQKFIDQMNKRNKPIDFFIHNAGIHIPKKALLTSEEQFMMQFKVNFLSPVKIMRQTINLLENGHIAVVASVVALAHGGVDVSTYTSSKNALYSYVNSFRQQLKVDRRKVTISMGCPYLIKTGMFDGFKTKLDFLFRQLEPQYVAKRLVKEFVMKKQICYVYQYEALLFRLVSFFPTTLLDMFSIHMNESNFKSIENKYQNRIKEMKTK